MFKKKDKGADESPAKKPLFPKKEKTAKPAKKSGGSLFGKKEKKPVNHLDDETVSSETGDVGLPPESANAKAGKPKPKAKKGGKGGAGLDLAKMDTKKLITGLVAVLIVLILLLVASIMMGGDEPVDEPMPAPQEQIQEPAPAVAPEAPAQEMPAPVSDQALPPPETPPAPVEQPVQQAPAVAPPVPATQAAPQQQAQPQQAAPKPAGTGMMTEEEFLRETQQRVYRERSTAPPTASR